MKINFSYHQLLGLTIVLFSLFYWYLYFFEHLPNGLNHDAAWNGLYATRLISGEAITPYVPEAYGRETLYHLSLSLVMYLFGINHASIIVTGYLWSIVAIVGAFYLFKELTKNRPAVIFGLIAFSFSSTLFVYAVSGWRLITLIALAPYALLSMMRFQHSSNLSRSIQLGLSSAALFYTYNAGRAQLIVLSLFLLINWLIKLSRKTLFHSAISVLTFFIATIPMLITAVKEPEIWIGRATTLSQNSDYLNNLIISLKLFNFSASGNDFFISQPALEHPITYLWLSGLILSIIKIKRFWPVVLFFCAFLLPPVVSTPSYHRAIGVYITLISFAVISLSFFGSFVKSKKKQLATLFLLIGIFSFSVYQRMLVQKIFFQPNLGFYPIATSVGQFVKQNLDLHHPVVILASNWPKDILSFVISPIEPNMVLAHNYQPYEYDGKDPTINLMIDITNNQINNQNAQYIIEQDKLAGFTKLLGDNECQFKLDQPITNLYSKNNPDKEVIAYAGKINCLNQ